MFYLFFGMIYYSKRFQNKWIGKRYLIISSHKNWANLIEQRILPLINDNALNVMIDDLSSDKANDRFLIRMHNFLRHQKNYDPVVYFIKNPFWIESFGLYNAFSEFEKGKKKKLNRKIKLIMETINTNK